MATETTHEATSQGAGAGAGRGRLWQVPTFFLGLLAVLGVAAAIPWWHEKTLGGLDHDIAVIRRALEQSDGSPERVLALAQKTLARAGADQAGELHFLLGSIYLRLAEHIPCKESAPSCKNALLHLQEAQKLGVPEEDRPKLMYRLGKAWFHTHHHWPEVIACLKAALPGGADDPAEGYKMLAKAYMRLPVPDLDRAYEANQKLLALPTLLDEDVLGPARVMCGDILVQKQKPAEALKILETVGGTAPRPVLLRARYLQGLCYQQLRAWGDAIPYWQEVLRGPDPLPGGRSRILYNLGLCFYRDNATVSSAASNAAEAWKQAVKEGGESGQAAAFRLAQLYLRANEAGEPDNPGAALEALGKALAPLKRPEDYRNELFPRKKACALLESACQVCRQGHDFERALQVAELYRHLDASGKARELEGQAAEAWARDLQGQPRPPEGQTLDGWKKQIQTQFQRAGTAFKEAARSGTGEARAKLLWESASCYLEGGLPPKAAAVLEEFVNLPGIPDAWRGEGWYRLGQTRKALGWQPQAYEAYYKAIEFPGPFEFQARYQLALSKLGAPADPKEAAQNLEAARAQLEQILSPDNQLVAPPEVQENARLQLARVLFLRKEYDKARLHFKEMLERYPNHPEVFAVRDQLAECYRRLADQEEDLEKQAKLPDLQIAFRQKKINFLDQAAQAYQALADDLAAREAGGTSTPEEKSLLRRARFNAAECRSGQPDMIGEALRLYRDLAEKHYAGRVEGLVAYQRMWWLLCNSLRQGSEAREVALHALKLAKELPDEAFTNLREDAFRGSPGPVPRGEWERWFQQAMKLAEQLLK